VGSPGELVRLVVGPEGEVAADLAGGAFGRGAWVHPKPECVANAPSGLARALRAEVRMSPSELWNELLGKAARRVKGLLITARRVKKLECGATAVEAAVLGRRAELVLVARDARAAADLPWVGPLVASGSALAFGNKADFGTWLGRPDTALVAVTDDRFAAEIRKTIEWTMVPEPDAPRRKARRTASSEAG